MPLTIFGWTRKAKTTPPTVLELVIETEIDAIKDVPPEEDYRNDRFELVIRPLSIPEVILRNENGSTERARLWHWNIGAFWYDYIQKSWRASLSMTTNLHDEKGKLFAEGFCGEENHIATYCALVHGQRFRFHRVELGMFRNSPIQFYPEVRVRIRCRECNEPRR